MKPCLECNETLRGRADKKFCCDGCRNSYNNKQNTDSTNLMRNINNKLRKNYSILKKLNPEGKTKTTRNKLVAQGFYFEYFTNILQTKTGNTYYFLYDHGYRFLEDDAILLVIRE